MSANGKTWVWTPEKSQPYFTKDLGKSWHQVKGLPENTRVLADRNNPMKFYAMSLFEGKLFISDDGGKNFVSQDLVLPEGLHDNKGNRGDSRGGQDRLYAAPDTDGDLWLAAFNGLYHSTDEGKTFKQTKGVEELHAFGFGKAAPKSDYSALYMVGIVNGVRGVFRSDNIGQNWIRINDDEHEWGLLLHITGDPKKYGRVYVGTHGRGTIYGDRAE